jgi:hypothetical protein
MEEIIFVKRASHNQLRTFGKPVIKLEIKNGRFIISNLVAKALKVDNNDGLMFGFNQKNKTAYVIKDDEDDAFKISRKDPHTLRFSSKDLLNYFDDTFNLTEQNKKSFVFLVNLTPTERGLHLITLI